MKAVAQLRGKITENQESASPIGIQKEFRRANEKRVRYYPFDDRPQGR